MTVILRSSMFSSQRDALMLGKQDKISTCITTYVKEKQTNKQRKHSKLKALEYLLLALTTFWAIGLKKPS